MERDIKPTYDELESYIERLDRQRTDAQATIAALQARVRELEEWKRIVTGAGTDQESVIRLAATEYTNTAVQCWKEANAKLESQLTQRTAELERVRGELVEATHNANVYQSLYSTGCMDRALLENELRDIRTLILALPKVEGQWTVSCAMADRVVEGGIVSDISEAVAAIVQHRQGMEG